MEYFQVFKVSSLTNHKGQELKKHLPKDISERLLNLGFEETKDGYTIPLVYIK